MTQTYGWPPPPPRRGMPVWVWLTIGIGAVALLVVLVMLVLIPLLAGVRGAASRTTAMRQSRDPQQVQQQPTPPPPAALVRPVPPPPVLDPRPAVPFRPPAPFSGAPAEPVNGQFVPTGSGATGRVIGGKGWQRVMDVRKGKMLQFLAEGQWNTWGGRPEWYCDANGNTKGSNHYDRSMPEGALIGRVGDIVFLVGRSATVPAPADGPLELRMNKGDRYLHDNVGEVTVTITR